MRRQFFKGLGWLVALNLLIKPLWIFGIDRQVQNAVGNAAYGGYFATLNLTIILLFIADAGLSNLMVQQLARGGGINTIQVLRLKFFLLLFYAFSCLAVAWLSSVADWQILLYLIAIQCFGSAFLFMRSLVAARQLFTADALFSVIDKTWVVLLCAPLVYGWSGTVTILSFLRLQAVASFIACLALLVFVRKNKLWQLSNKGESKNVLLATAPFAIIILLMAAHYRLDGFLLNRLHTDGARQTGIYAAAYRLLDAANMIGYLVASFLVPFIARNRNNMLVVESTTTWLRHGLMGIGVGISCFTVLFASWVQQLMYHTNNGYNASIIQFTVAVLPAYYIIHIYGSVLTAIGSLRRFILVLIMGVCINIAANLLLIPSLGAVGCCISALVSQYSCAAACFIVANREMNWRPSFKPWVVYILVTLGYTSWLLLLKHLLVSVWVILAATIMAMGLIAFLQRRPLRAVFKTSTAHA